MRKKLGELVNGLFIGDNDLKDYFKVKPNYDTLMGLALSQGPMTVGHSALYGASRANSARKLSAINERANNTIDNWDKVRAQLDNLSFGERKMVALQASNNKELGVGAVDAIKEYTIQRTYHDGLTGAAEGKQEVDFAQAVINGQALLTTINDKRSVAINRLAKEIESYKEILGEGYENLPESEWTPEMFEAKQKMDIAEKEMETVETTLVDEAKKSIEPHIKLIDQYTSQEGTIGIVSIGTPENPEIVYLVSGTIAMKDGEKDLMNSDASVVVVDIEGNKTSIPQHRINNFERVDSKEYKEQFFASAYKQHVEPLVVKLEGKEKFKQGEDLTFLAKW